MVDARTYCHDLARRAIADYGGRRRFRWWKPRLRRAEALLVTLAYNLRDCTAGPDRAGQLREELGNAVEMLRWLRTRSDRGESFELTAIDVAIARFQGTLDEIVPVHAVMAQVS